MRTLTAKEFLKITRENPQWAKTLNENVTITGDVILPENHPLKALSSKLIFKNHANFSGSQISVAEGVFHQGVNFSYSQVKEIGKLSVLGTDKEGNTASFYGCKQLRSARGTFPGFVDFSASTIQEIADDLNITAPDEKGNAASFCDCENLSVAKGTFPGWVNFSCSGIQRIAEDLHVTAPDEYGNAATFYGCDHLTVAKGTFPGFVSFIESGIQKIAEDLHITAPNQDGNAANFDNCQNLKIASGKFCGTVYFSKTPITHTRNLKITVPEGKPKAVFTELCLEESPFPLEEIKAPQELKKKLHRKTIQKQIIHKLHKNLEKHFPPIPQDI